MSADKEIEKIDNVIHTESVDKISNSARKNETVGKAMPEILIARMPDKPEKPKTSNNRQCKKQGRSDIVWSIAEHTEGSSWITHVGQVKEVRNNRNCFSQCKLLLNDAFSDLVADDDRCDHYTHFKKSIHSPLAVYVILSIDFVFFNLTKQCFFRNICLQCRLIDFSTVLSQGPYDKLFLEKIFCNLKVHDHFF